MQQQSVFVKAVIWLMIFLMSIGFALLVISPFLDGSSLFGSSSPQGQAEKSMKEARSKVRDLGCEQDTKKLDSATQTKCIKALQSLGTSYLTMGAPSEPTKPGEDPVYPKDAEANWNRGLAAYKAAYDLDPTNEKSALLVSGLYRDLNKYEQAITVVQQLIKQHPKEQKYYRQLAEIQTVAAQYDEAVATYQKYLRSFPQAADVSVIKDKIAEVRKQKKDAAASGGSGLPISIN